MFLQKSSDNIIITFLFNIVQLLFLFFFPVIQVSKKFEGITKCI